MAEKKSAIDLLGEAQALLAKGKKEEALARAKEALSVAGDSVKGLISSFINDNSSDKKSGGSGGAGTAKKGGKKAPEVNFSQNRLSEQAALILGIDKILEQIKEKKGDKFVTAQDKYYKNFSPVRANSVVESGGGNQKQIPTGHFFLTQFLTKNTNMQAFFESMPPTVMSLLIPSIKIYKTFFPKFSLDSKYIEGYDWRIPFDNVPLEFQNESSEFVIKTPDEVLNGNGSFRTAGILSFSYTFKGNNPAEVNTNIAADLKLFFQSPIELVQEIPVEINDPRFLNKPTQGTGLKFKYSDLFNQSSRTKTVKVKENNIERNTAEANTDYYRIKIECGYADINPEILKDVLLNYYRASQSSFNQDDFKKYFDKIQNAIQSTKVVLFLSPYKYDLSFAENGTIQLSINFNASMDAMMISPQADIFFLSNEAKNLEERQKKLQQLLQIESKIQNITESKKKKDAAVNNCIDIKNLNEFLLKLKKESGLDIKKKEDLIDLLNKEKVKSYNSLANFLVGKEDIHKEAPNENIIIRPKIYTASFPPEFLAANTNQDVSDKFLAKALKDSRTDAIKQFNIKVSSTPDKSLFSVSSETGLPKKEKQDKKNKKPIDISEIPLKNLDDKTATFNSSKKVENIKFILLGDILDIALETLNKVEPKSESPKVILGTIPMFLPDPDAKLIDSGVKRFSQVKEKAYNIADIPISYNLFQEFLIKNIVKANKTRYPVLQFIKDVISQLVTAALAPNILGITSGINSNTKISTAYFTFEKAEGNKDPLNLNDNADLREYPTPVTVDTVRLLEQKASNIKFNVYKPSDSSSSQKFVNYVFIYCSGRFPKNLTGEEQDDIKRGVMHVRMGTDMGIVQKINFTVNTSPYVREMLARREGNGQGTTIKQYYNATVEMFGNDIFRPGDYIYIHPNYIFYNKNQPLSQVKSDNKEGGNIIDLQDTLGLGGYYLVTSVNTNIATGAYTTKIECTFQAAKIQGTKNAEIEEANRDPCEGKGFVI